MSCPECGTRISLTRIRELLFLTFLIMAVFSLALFFLPTGLFLATSVVLLFGLRFVQARFKVIDSQELKCPACGHVLTLAHSH